MRGISWRVPLITSLLLSWAAADCMLAPAESLQTRFAVVHDSFSSPLWEREYVYVFRPDTAAGR